METNGNLNYNQQLENENVRLRQSLQELSILNEIATAISSTMELNKLTDLMLQKCIKHLNAEQGSIMLLNESDLLNPFHTMIRKADQSDTKHALRFGNQLNGWMLKNKQPLISNDLMNDSRFNVLPDEHLDIMSLISVPLCFKGKMIGLISVFNKKEYKKFSQSDQKLLSIIAAQSAHVIENARLLEEEKQYLLIQEELKMAKEIQLNLLPTILPEVKGYDIAAFMQPAKEIGGDYYDFINAAENEIAFCVGDVSGKGLPAAVLMGNLQATIRGQCIIPSSVSEKITRANKLLYQSTDPSKFATFFYAELDKRTGSICYCNAGHNFPIVFHKDGKYDLLDVGGTILGSLPDFPFHEKVIQLKDGDTLLLYSDGVSEAMNKDEEEFGDQKLIDILKNNLNSNSKELIKKIYEAVKLHAGETPQSDDITIMIIKKEDIRFN